MQETKRDNFARIVEPEGAIDRLRRAVGATRRLLHYRQLLDAARQKGPDKKAGPVPHGLLVERAYGAEQDVRMLLKDGIDAANELRDSSRLWAVLRPPPSRRSRPTRLTGSAPPSGRSASRSRMTSRFRPPSSTTPTAGWPTGSWTSGRRAATFGCPSPGPGTRPEPIGLPGPPPRSCRPGRLGRVLSPGLSGGVLSMAGRCCRNAQKSGSQEERNAVDTTTASAGHDDAPLDIYAGLMAGAASAREAIYRHARRTEEIGPGAVRGEEAISALLVAGVIIGFLLITAGVAIEIQCAIGAAHDDVCNFGEWLILGGLVVLGVTCVTAAIVAPPVIAATAGCELVVQSILVIAA